MFGSCRPGRALLLLQALFFLFALPAVAQTETPPAPQASAEAQPAPASEPQGSASAGEALFSGKRRFQNGGPACFSCHQTAAIPFPNGGTLGPDLSGEYGKLGDPGMDVVLSTLFFPTMRPLFDAHPLTPEEQQHLKVFFAQTDAAPPPASITPKLGGIAVAGFLVFLAIAGFAGRKRLRPVRAQLVRRSIGGSRP